MRKSKIKTKSQLKKEADAVFSKYIRLKNSDWRENCTCVTCGKVDHWKKMQNGHYISRGDHILRFDEGNCHVQCVGCNIFKKGNMVKYTIFMEKKYGDGIVQKLDKESKKTIQRTCEDYQVIIDKYKEKIENLNARV